MCRPARLYCQTITDIAERQGSQLHMHAWTHPSDLSQCLRRSIGIKAWCESVSGGWPQTHAIYRHCTGVTFFNGILLFAILESQHDAIG
eukprot:6475247-Amphidinium_carterae.1